VHLSSAQYMSRPLILLDHPNKILWGVKCMKLLVMQFPSVPCYHLALRPKYRLQDQVVTHSQPIFVPQYEFCICLCWNLIFSVIFRLVSFIILLEVKALLRRDLDVWFITHSASTLNTSNYHYSLHDSKTAAKPTLNKLYVQWHINTVLCAEYWLTFYVF
jgi:hypothetical protein